MQTNRAGGMSGIRTLLAAGLCMLVVGLLPPSTRTMAAAGGWEGLIAAYNGCGQRLFKALARKPGNIVLSPYSIGTAMAMALAAASGETEIEMASVLGLALPRERIDSANAAVLASFNTASSATFQLHVANAVMLTKNGTQSSQDYIDVLRDDYAAEVFRGADLATVNRWVKEKTVGKIDSILDRLDPMAALVLLDAIYFKGRWETPFRAEATQKETFHLVNGDIKVPTMRVRADFALAERPGYRAIRMPYAGGRASMIVVLPDGGTTDVVARFDDDEMRSLLAALHGPGRSTDLALPRFKINFKAALIDAFADMGMHQAFNAKAADFSGMTGKPLTGRRLAIDQIVHRAFIDVAEDGTEAAAATGISIVATAMRPTPVETFRVDRPFLFAVIDEETGAVLFEGRVDDPRQAS